MASPQARKRLGKEYQAIQKQPPPFVLARPSEANILEWHFIFRGPPDSEYTGGEYYGTVVFPPDYPFKPPGLKMLTPSGRFQPDRKICTSMSDYHPGTWNPAWSTATILTGLLSFMLSEDQTTGSVRATTRERKAFAEASHAWNVKHPKFKAIFPEYCGPEMKDLPDMGIPPAPAASGSNTDPTPTANGSVQTSLKPTSSTATTAPAERLAAQEQRILRQAADAEGGWSWRTVGWWVFLGLMLAWGWGFVAE